MIPSDNSLHTTLLVRCLNRILNRRRAYLVGTDIESEPFEDPVETKAPELPHNVAPLTLLSDNTTPTLVPILRRTVRMAVRVSHPENFSVGLLPSRVILFGDIPTVIPSTSRIAPETSTIAPAISSAAPVVEMTLGSSPIGLCGLVPYSDSNSDSPDEMDSLDYITLLPATSPFLYTDSPEASDSSDGPPSQDPYVTAVAHWRSRVATRSSSPSDFPVTPVHSSDLDAPDQAHSGSLTRVVTPRLGYPPVRAPQHNEAFHSWCVAPLSTFYPPTTLESSAGDSSERLLHSSSHSAGPSRKRCRSPADSVPLYTPVTGSLAPTRADLLPPRKRFRDSYSSEASMEENTEVDPTETEVDMELEEYEADTDARDTVEVGIDPRSIPVTEEESEEPAGEDSFDSSGTRDGIVRSFKDMPIDLDDAVCDFYHHMSKVHIDRIVEIETVQSRLEADQLIPSGERARIVKRIYSLRLENLKVRAMLIIERDQIDSIRWHMALSQEEFRQVRRDRDDTRRRLRRLESTMTVTRSGMTSEAIKELINCRVEEALAAHEEAHAANALEAENQSQNGSDGNNGNGGNGGNRNRGNRNRGNGNGGNDNGRGDRPVARECTYQDFMNALTWWNSHKTTIGIDAAYAFSWRELMKLMAKVYCLRNEIQKIETELWNLSVKNNDMATYTQSFQELTMMCTKMVPEEEDRVEKFIRGLPDNIQGNVIAAAPTRLQDTVRIANNLMDKKLKGYAVRNAENKRRLDNNYRNNRGQQPPHKRQNTGGQNVARAYTASNNEKNGYRGTLPFCNRCRLHHEGQCTMKCNN
ncbi:putative reverse transcriptase domain-containing protein, partial [Tanacetum coccineum]